jgi:hypothetical protein
VKFPNLGALKGSMTVEATVRVISHDDGSKLYLLDDVRRR